MNVPKIDGSKDWATALFTSEIGFFLHLPIWLTYSTDAHTPFAPLRNAIFIARIGLHALALPLLVWDARHNLWSWETFNSVFYGTYTNG